MPGSFLIGRTTAGNAIPVKVNSNGELVADVGAISLGDVEIKNDSGNPIPVADAGSSLTVDGKAYRTTTTITRPSNATAYTAGDVVGDTSGSAILTFTSAGPSGGFLFLQSASLVFSDSVVPSGMSAFRLHLYDATPTATADNAAFDLLSGERANYMGYVDFSTPQDFGSSLYTQVDYPGRLLKLATASTTLYAELETRGAYTPVSASTVQVRMNLLEAGL
jgi:hypothetical protein